MANTDEHKARIADAMTQKWQDPAYRERRGEKARVLREMWAEPETRKRMTVSDENTIETVKAFVLAEIDRRVLAPRRAELEAARKARQTVVQVIREERQTRREQAQELRRQARALYQQAKELEK